jgi:ribosome-associated heat shock protein Hsp15
VKTRSLAARLCADGLVKIGVKIATRCAEPVHRGDIVTLSYGGWRRSIEVFDFGERRGPPSEAQALYRVLGEPVKLSITDPDWTPLIVLEPEDR